MKRWDQVTIDQFSGPIELLWTMIKDKKISIVKLSLLEIVDQYLDYIKQQKELDIEIASEYLTIAAQLIEMKSRKLIPVVDDEQISQDHDFDDLVERIEQYNQIKIATDFFIQSQNQYFETLSKKRSKQNFAKEIQFQSDELLLDPLDIDLDKFTEIFKSVISKSKINEYNEDFDFENEIYQTLTTQTISPQQIATTIINKMKANKVKEWTLFELLDGIGLNIKNLVACFLAVLDLTRYQIMNINQRDNNIFVEFKREVIEDETIINKQLEQWESENNHEY
ncbi:segregation and condensation protein A [Mycoplasma yeatsii]|uniref:Segregation and condensation protein A n=2 Tax=Mycoplasma yeatsii TaxID=51365 RepID=S6G422_9MOLU|nr:segregation/condensation protein A [Mycoplasma yeatsii]EOA07507.1 Segregation and condensation protein A [Mycoplasma yeatsii 13926]MDQ0567776.1 segregation and condensation protein A [Mycoplasma yeatsii]